MSSAGVGSFGCSSVLGGGRSFVVVVVVVLSDFPSEPTCFVSLVSPFLNWLIFSKSPTASSFLPNWRYGKLRTHLILEKKILYPN